MSNTLLPLPPVLPKSTGRFKTILTSASDDTWRVHTQHPKAISSQPTSRPTPPPYNIAQACNMTLWRDVTPIHYHTILSDSDSPYYISNWQPPTLYPVTSAQADLWLLCWGSHEYPMGRIYTKSAHAILRGVELETFRLYGRKLSRPLAYMTSLTDAILYNINKRTTRGISLAHYIDDHFEYAPGHDILPSPANGMQHPLMGLARIIVARDFAQRWAVCGYQYPERKQVSIDLLMCRLWRTMNSHERTIYLTARERSLYAAYHAIPKPARKAILWQYHPDAPSATFAV